MTKEEVNKRLIENYGFYEDGQPLLRVVWSTDETELRVGYMEQWYGDIFVRGFHGTGEFKKYSYCPDRWILEIRQPTNNAELTTKLSYEPIYVFQDKFGDFLPLNWDVIVAFMNARQNVQRKPPMTWEREIALEQEQNERQKNEILKKLKDRQMDHFDWKIRDKEAVFAAQKRFEPSIGMDVHQPTGESDE